MRGSFDYIPNFLNRAPTKQTRNINKKIGHVNEAIKFEELESIMNVCADKVKQTPSAYYIKGEERTSRTYEK